MSLLLLAAGEVAARVLPPAEPGRAELEPAVPELGRPVREPAELRYELVPAQVSRQSYPAAGQAPAQEVVYTVNALGFRGEEVVSARVPGERRVVVLGDSLVFGTGVPDADTMPALLQVELRGALGDERISVLNLGVPGYEAPQLLAALEHRAVPLEPHVVVLCLYENDAYAEPGAWARSAEDEGSFGGGLGRVLRTSRLLERGLERLERATLAARREQELQGLWQADGAGWARVRELLERAAELAEQRGFALHVTLHPRLTDRDGVPFTEAHDRLAEHCRAADLQYHDLREALRGREGLDLWAHPLDPHPNARCNGLVAGHLARCLEPDLRAAAGD